jgi:AraC-like DNA-binding protein
MVAQADGKQCMRSIRRAPATAGPRIIDPHFALQHRAEFFESNDEGVSLDFLKKTIFPVKTFSSSPGCSYWLSLAGFALPSVYLSRSATFGGRSEIVPTDHVMLIISENGSCSIEARATHVSSSMGRTAILSPLDRHIYKTAELDEGFILSADLNEVARHVASEENDRSLRSALAKPLAFDLTSPSGSAAHRAVLFVWQQLINSPISRLPSALEAAYDEILLHALTTLLTPALIPDTPRNRVASDLVRRACEFIRAQASEPIRIVDIAEMLGVSVRHLQAGFRRHLDTTPHRFLRECRLELANTKLISALPGDTVTRIALDCGFAHLSDFAGLYQRRFGEKPSQTFRRTRLSM